MYNTFPTAFGLSCPSTFAFFICPQEMVPGLGRYVCIMVGSPLIALPGRPRGEFCYETLGIIRYTMRSSVHDKSRLHGNPRCMRGHYRKPANN